MRLLLTADTVGGVWTYALELARVLARHEFATALATMGAPLTPAQRQEAEAVPGLEVHASDFKLEWMEDPWENVQRAGEWLLRLEERFRPDVVHLNGYAHGALPWRAPTLMVGHSCVLSWWDAVREDDPPASWDRYRQEVTRGLRAAGLVAAPTRAMLAALQQFYGPLPRTRVLPNGRDAARFRPAPKEPMILAAGRLWDEAKNIGALDRAAEGLPWPVCVAGSDLHPGGGVAGFRHVRALGRLAPDELAGWLGRASIYALPARYEPFGLSVLEAAFAGCALVLGDIPSLREVWGDGARFVPPDDHAGLARELRRLIDEPETRSEMARRARERAFEYTPERMAAGYLTAYRCLLERRPPQAAEVPAETEENQAPCAS